MAGLKNPHEPRGLKSIAQARADRAAGRYRSTATAGVVAGCAIVAALVINAFVSSHKLKTEKSTLLARQRSIVESLGPDWTKLRANVEGEVARMGAEPYAGDFVDPDAKHWNFSAERGLYIRFGTSDAKKPIAELAEGSGIDALAVCLLRDRPAGRHLGDGGPESEVFWNVNDLYSRLAMLKPGWGDHVEEAAGDYELRSFRYQFDEQVHNEMPRILEILKGAGFVMVAVDEDAGHDGGASGEAPFTRVGLYDLHAGKERLRMRGRGQALVRSVSEQSSAAASVQAAAQIQVNNCDLASQVIRKLRGDGAK